jgi:hypothetical protein
MAPDELVKRYARAYKDAALITSLGTWIWYATVAILIIQFWPVVRRGTDGLVGLGLVFMLLSMFPIGVAGFVAGMLIRKLGSLASVTVDIAVNTSVILEAEEKVSLLKINEIGD